MQKGSTPTPADVSKVAENSVQYETAEHKAVETPEPKPLLPVTQANITTAWAECKQQFAGDMQLHVIASTAELALRSATELQCTVQAATQQSTFEQKIQPHIIRHFRTVFGTSFSVHIVVPEVVTEQKLYSPHEKFDYLAQKNPAVEILKQKLLLEL